MNNLFLSLISRINFSSKKQDELSLDVLEEIEIKDSEVEEFDLQLNPFYYLDKNVKYFTYFGNKYRKTFVRRKFDRYKDGAPSYHSLSHIIGISILFRDDLKIKSIWLHGKDIVCINCGVGYPGKLPFGLSFGMNRDELIRIMHSPDHTIDSIQPISVSNTRTYHTKWDFYYFYEGSIEFGFDYEAERLDQLRITKLPEDIEIIRQTLPSYQSIHR
jgi:hypothetical protein